MHASNIKSIKNVLEKTITNALPPISITWSIKEVSDDDDNIANPAL